MVQNCAFIDIFSVDLITKQPFLRKLRTEILNLTK